MVVSSSAPPFPPLTLARDAARIEAQYLGETARRSPLIAAALSFAGPGTAWAYLGRPTAGALLNIAVSGLWLGFVGVWARKAFFPAVPLAVFAGCWLALLALAALDAARFAGRVGDDFVLRDGNHPLVYAAVALFTFALPLAGIHHFALNQVWSTVTVPDDAMQPTLGAGDVLLVRNLRYTYEPQVGEIVAFQLESDVPRLGRVVGVPGDHVAMDDSLVFNNDQPAVRFALNDEDVETLNALGATAPDQAVFRVESMNQRSYPISTPYEPSATGPREWSLEDDQFLVLHDARGNASDSRSVGPLSRDQIIGRPLYVARSGPDAAAGSTLSVLAFPLGASGDDERRGRRVQPRVAAR